jgi:hypothetical protein
MRTHLSGFGGKHVSGQAPEGDAGEVGEFGLWV